MTSWPHFCFGYLHRMKNTFTPLRRSIWALGLLALTASQLSAATLARWTPVSTALPRGVDYDQGTDTPVADEVEANIVVSTLVRERPGTFTNEGVNWPGLAENSFDVDSGFTTFTITPDNGFAVNFDELTYSASTFGGADAAGYTVSIRSSLDDFAANVTTQDFTASAPNLVFDISSLQGVQEAITFRVYAVNNNPTPPTNSFFDLRGSNTDNTLGLLVSGDVVPIPEPSSLLLCGLAGLGLTVRRKR